MRRRSLPFRLLTVLFAAVQLLLPTVASLVDGGHAPAGRVARADAGAVRVEQHSEQSCVPLTTDACAFCELLSLRGTPAEVRVPVPAQVLRAAAALPAAVQPAARECVGAETQPRAPPVA